MNKCASILIAIVLVLPACQSGERDTTGQKSDGFPAPSKELVYEAALRVVREQGYVPSLGECAADAGIIKSRWRTSLQPFAGKGHREQVTVRIHDVPQRVDYYRVETNVTRELNMNMVEPSNPMMAEWEQPVRVPEMENMITRLVEMSFLPMGPSRRWRGTHGIDPGPDPRLEIKEPPKKKSTEEYLEDFFK